MLRSVRELENIRILNAAGALCSRLKDVYFDDSSWQVKHLVAAPEPRHFGQKQILIKPADVVAWDSDELWLSLDSEQIGKAPPASSVLPVCKQYASLALASPGSGRFEPACSKSDPHLRSAKAISNYRIMSEGEFGGTLADLLIDPETWEVRHLAVEQIFDRKKAIFYITPQAVERFSWSTQRVFVRSLQPVILEGAASFSSGAGIDYAVA